MPPKRSKAIKKSTGKKKPKAQEEPKSGECTICFEPFDADYGILKCQHIYCFKCIESWSEKENTCPLCKSRFSFISRYQKENDELSKSRVAIKKKNQAETNRRISGLGDINLISAYQMLAWVNIARLELQNLYNSEDDEDYVEEEDDQDGFYLGSFIDDFHVHDGTHENPIHLYEEDELDLEQYHSSSRSATASSSSPEIIDLTEVDDNQPSHPEASHTRKRNHSSVIETDPEEIVAVASKHEKRKRRRFPEFDEDF